jgi:Zn-finger protein
MAQKMQIGGSWRGKMQPKRGRCPNCQKRGLGQFKATSAGVVIRECRYCPYIDRDGFEEVLPKTLRADD